MAATGNALEGIGDLLASFGVAQVDTRDEVVEEFDRAAVRRGLSARAVGLRFGTLAVDATAFDAQMLRFEQQAILDELESAAPGVVARLSVRVRGVRAGEAQ